MISPELGKAGFVIGCFVVLTSGGLLLAVDRDSAEFVLSLIMFVIGVLFLLLITVLVRMGTRRQ